LTRDRGEQIAWIDQNSAREISAQMASCPSNTRVELFLDYLTAIAVVPLWTSASF